jgi:HAD superfamily hydrolase (TIGR01509 family)
MPLYGLIFDVDGLIANTEPLNARVTIQIFKDLFGVQGMQPADFDAGLGRGAEAYVRAGAAVRGIPLSEAQVAEGARLREQYLVKAIREEGVPAFPGVLDLIHAGLARPDFRLAIATSASHELAQAMLESTGVPYQRMSCVYGDQVRRRKPDPEIFLAASRKMDVQPGRCVVFEDSPSGVQAAKAAGSRCVAVTNTVKVEELSEADLVCDSLEGVDIDVIRRMIDKIIDRPPNLAEN